MYGLKEKNAFSYEKIKFPSALLNVEVKYPIERKFGNLLTL